MDDITQGTASKVGSVFGVSHRWLLGEGRKSCIIGQSGQKITPKELHSRASWIRDAQKTSSLAIENHGAFALRDAIMIRNSLLGPLSAAFAEGRHMAIMYDCREFAAKMRKKYGSGDNLKHKMKNWFDRLPETSRHAADLLAIQNQRERERDWYLRGEIARLMAENDRLQNILDSVPTEPKSNPRKARAKS
jgi:hypothetical protein